MNKQDYKQYMKSAAWQAKKQAYWNSKLSKNCVGCRKPFDASFHMHHRTYRRLGNERLNDLAPVCQSCHNKIHELHAQYPRWGLWKCTNKIAARYKHNKL